jgi:ABC-type nitrate/sulfonate/bicarbonate transport system substrate-binding protein
MLGGKKSGAPVVQEAQTGRKIAQGTALTVLVVFLLAPNLAHSQTRTLPEKKISVGFIYEALTLTNTPIWVAEDQGLFDKHGLDVRVILARGATPVQALVSGSVEFGGFSGSSTVAANLGGSDLVFVAAKPNFTVISIWAKKDSSIRTLADLRGKTLGVSRAGSATHTIARIALRTVGINDQDVKYLYHGGLPEIFASLDKGLVDAALASAPRPGFRELADLSTLKIPFLQGAIEVQRAFLLSRRQTVLSFLKGYVAGILVAKERPELAVASIVKRLKVAPEAARSSYPSHANVWEELPYVRKESVQAILEVFPKETLKNVTPEKFIDNSLLKELEDSGFVRGLYRK